MNVFAGNILIWWDQKVVLDEFDYIESFSSNGDKAVYIFWETEINSRLELEEFLVSKLWKIKSYDISISSECAVWVAPYDYESWIYECATFEWENINFDDIAERFEDSEWVFSIRESETSCLFWNKVIKVDFIY